MLQVCKVSGWLDWKGLLGYFFSDLGTERHKNISNGFIKKGDANDTRGEFDLLNNKRTR
jgi:hypothetical protein